MTDRTWQKILGALLAPLLFLALYGLLYPWLPEVMK